MKIDVHVHADFTDEELQWQAANIGRVDFSFDGLMAEMAANGVAQAVSLGFESQHRELSIDAPNPLGMRNPTEPTDLPPKLLRVGGINPYRLDEEGRARIGAALGSRQIMGLKVYLGYYHKPPDDDTYKRVYDLAARHQVPVIFHTGDTYSMNARVRFAHPLPIDDVAVEFRDVVFVLAHLGNPWTMDAAEVVYKNPNVYADLSGLVIGDEAYFSNPDHQEAIEMVIERTKQAFAYVGDARKFMYGSDWPLVPMRPYIETVKRAIPAKFHEQVFYSNAREVFKLQ